MTKAGIEEREKIREPDPRLGGNVPAALVSYRAIAERYPDAAELALWKMGDIYEELRRYDLAAEAFSTLGARFPSTRYDAWFLAGDLYEKRLKDEANAREAYGRVPPTSSRYGTAQRRIADLTC